MAILKNIFRHMRFWKRTSDNDEFVENSSDQELTRTLKHYEYYVYKIQNILVWENPSESLCTVAAVNLLFWIFVNLEWRLYGILFTGLLITTVHEAWNQRIWPEIRVQKKKAEKKELLEFSDIGAPLHPSVVMLSQLIESSRKLMKDYYAWLKTMREQNPGTFCCMMTGTFFVLSVIGRIVPGLLLSYLVLMTALTGPGIWVHLVPEDTKQALYNRWETVRSILHPSGDSMTAEEEEYMLEDSGENLALLSQIVDPELSNESFNSRGTN